MKKLRLVQCSRSALINPSSGNCVEIGSSIIDLFKTRPELVDVVPFYQVGPQNKVLIRNLKNPIILEFCGPNKIINPIDKTCIDINSQIGIKLRSLPHTFINIPKPQKIDTPLQNPKITINPNPQKISQPKKFPAPKIPKLPKDSLPLDTSGDGYVSIKEYLAFEQSKGSLERPKGRFNIYNQRNLGIYFILTLIQNEVEYKKKNKNSPSPIDSIACLPTYHLCIWQHKHGHYVVTKASTLKTYKDCKQIDYDNNKCFCELPTGQTTTNIKDYTKILGNPTHDRATIYLFNAPLAYGGAPSWSNPPKLFYPSNLAKIIDNCITDGKRLVVFDLTLLESADPLDTSHANVILIDLNNYIIERFDPHGGNSYKFIKLDNDPTNKIRGRDDFSKNKNIQSTALFNQADIDDLLNREFGKIFNNKFTYKGVNYTVPYLGPQIKTDALGGLCVTWSCMYIVLRLLNPDMPPYEITKRMIDGTKEQLLDKILRFQKYIINTLKKARY